jgi:hypothetical protein
MEINRDAPATAEGPVHLRTEAERRAAAAGAGCVAAP